MPCKDGVCDLPFTEEPKEIKCTEKDGTVCVECAKVFDCPLAFNPFAEMK